MEQMNFNMNRYGVEQDVIEVPEEEFSERVCGWAGHQTMQVCVFK